MNAKDGVNLSGMTHETIEALFVCDEVYRGRGLRMVVTSANDHHDGPYHCMPDGSCRAFDLRLPSRMAHEAMGVEWTPVRYPFDESVHRELMEELGRDFDVVLERDAQNAWQWHIHVEHDPD
jgi:hypothetical protein